MKLDAWQVRLCRAVLEVAAYHRWRAEPSKTREDKARARECRALEAMAAALESGESLEVGP